jgi:hypothetical protein
MRPGIGEDLDRLGATAKRAMPPALLLAFVSAGLLAASSLALAPFQAGVFVLAILLVWFHAVFIAALTWQQVHPGRPILRCAGSPGLVAGAILAVPILAFALLDMFGASYFCADGAAHDRSAIPDWPWLWIGWAVLALGALPARAVGLIVGERPPLLPLWRRFVLALPFAPLLWLFGSVFEWRQVSCAPPFDNPGWGLFEGGMFLFPLLGLFWFTASLSLAVHSAASVDPEVARPRATGVDGSSG